MNRIIILLLFVVGYQSAFGQGSLSPTAAPAPTMKTLTQIEPRTAITSTPYTISGSGSYYLTTNFTVSGSDAITINSSDVSLDLNGFTLLFGGGNAFNGISAGTVHDIVIRNGILRNWSYDGVNAYGTSNCRFEKLQFYGSGNIGLEAGVGSVVSDCGAYSNVVAGFSLAMAGSGGDISHCVATGNGTGIVASAGCVMTDCSVSGNTSDGINVGVGTGVKSCTSYQNGQNGITTANNCIVKDCAASNNGSEGIYVIGSDCSIINCTACGNFLDGIHLQGVNDCLIADNVCSGNSRYGIAIYGQSWFGRNRIDGNNVGANSFYGIYPAYANVTNSITRNSAPGNGVAGFWNYAGNKDYAPTGSVSTATNPWTNFE